MIQKLQALDFLVIAIYAAGMILVGVYFNRKTKTSDDYMLGGRRMNPWMVGISFFATLFSALSYLAKPGEMVKYGPMYWCIIFTYPFSYAIVGWLLIPRIMRKKVSTAYELLEVHLGLSVRLFASTIFVFMRLVWMGVIIYLCAEKIIIPIMGWSDKAALWVSILMGVITIVYTSMGGLRAVVITDAIQSLILLSAAVLSIVLITGNLGSFGALIPQQWPENWLEWKFFDTSARISFVTAFISGITWRVFTAGSDQMAIQRYLATKDVKSARKVFLISLLTDILVGMLLAVLGLGLLAYFQHHSNLLPEGSTVWDVPDSLFTRFIVVGLPPGISGLTIAGLMAAAMSSLSSGVNSSCMVISRDFIVRCKRQAISDLQQLQHAKYISLGIGVAAVLLSLLVDNIKGNLLEVAFKTINLFVSPLFVPFFMALFIPRASTHGTFWGMMVSVIVSGLISFSAELFGHQISFLWIIPGSFLAGITISIIITVIWPGKVKTNHLPDA